MRVFLVIALAFVGASQCGYAVSQSFDPPSAEELLQRVGQSLRNNSYRGRITYEHSGRLEVVDIEHRVLDGVEHERVRFLNGPEQELVKTGRLTACPTKGGLLLSGEALEHEGAIASISKSYRSHYLGAERVAGKVSWVLQMIPLDDHRHSFVLAVDQRSYLPTKTLYVARSGKPLERLHFVDLDTAIDVAAPEKTAATPDQAAAASIAHIASATCPPRDGSLSASKWKPSWIPAGFVKSAYEFSPVDGHVETYTDGLASFSVIAKAVTEIAETAVMPGNVAHFEGATVIVMRLVAHQNKAVRLALVGEIPGETAQRILGSVEATED